MSLYGLASKALPTGSKITLAFQTATAYRLVVDELTGVTTLDQTAGAAGHQRGLLVRGHQEHDGGARGGPRCRRADRELPRADVGLGLDAGDDVHLGHELRRSCLPGHQQHRDGHRVWHRPGSWTASVLTFRP